MEIAVYKTVNVYSHLVHGESSLSTTTETVKAPVTEKLMWDKGYEGQKRKLLWKKFHLAGLVTEQDATPC